MAFSLGLVFKELISMRTLCAPLLLLYLKCAEIHPDFVLLGKCLLSNYHVPGLYQMLKIQ